MMDRTGKSLIAIVILDLIMVAFTLFRFPSSGLIHASPVIISLILFGIIIIWSWHRLSPEARFWGVRLGGVASLILCGEVLLEYIILPIDNSKYGLIEYGLFLLILIISGALAYRENRSLLHSTQAGLLTGLISSLIWFGVLLLVMNWFWGSSRQAQVFMSEGEGYDFIQSGMASFTTFVVQDYFGAGFFHIILGAILGVFLGFIGGLFGRITQSKVKFQKT
jgi:hypothetical protein